MLSIRLTLVALACASVLPSTSSAQDADVIVRNARIWTGGRVTYAAKPFDR